MKHPDCLSLCLMSVVSTGVMALLQLSLITTIMIIIMSFLIIALFRNENVRIIAGTSELGAIIYAVALILIGV